MGVCATVVLFGAGCLGGVSTPATGPDGGIFRLRAVNNALEWKQLKLLNLGTKIASIADVGTATAAFDPQDPLSLYVGTAENGLIFSLDGGESWQSAKGLSIGRVSAISVDAKDKCVVYVARTNQIFKTENCGRDWNQVFFNPHVDQTFTALATDWFNTSIVYAGTTDGDLFRSDDGGKAWRALTRVEGIRIMTIAVDPRDSRTVYTATYGAGVLKSVDGGNTWMPIRKQFEDFERARFPRAVILDPLVANRVYHISKFGILRSDDGGGTWKPLTLPTANSTMDIKALALHPKDAKRLVYATDTSIVFSADGGVTWSPQKLPTTRGVSFLLYDKSDAPSIFLGALPAKK